VFSAAVRLAVDGVETLSWPVEFDVLALVRPEDDGLQILEFRAQAGGKTGLVEPYPPDDVVAVVVFVVRG